MASYMTDSTERQNGMQPMPTNRVRCINTLPYCGHNTRDESARLATFSALCSRDVIKKVSPIRLAGSGCVFDDEEDYIECSFCGTITRIENMSAMNILYDLKHYHRSSCSTMETYMLKQERAIHQGIVNLDILKRMRHQRLLSYGIPSYGELIQEYGVTPRIQEFDVVDLCYDP